MIALAYRLRHAALRLSAEQPFAPTYACACAIAALREAAVALDLNVTVPEAPEVTRFNALVATLTDEAERLQKIESLLWPAIVRATGGKSPAYTVDGAKELARRLDAQTEQRWKLARWHFVRECERGEADIFDRERLRYWWDRGVLGSLHVRSPRRSHPRQPPLHRFRLHR